MKSDRSARNFSLVKKIIFSAIAVLLIFGLLEGVLRISGSTFHPHYSMSEGRWASHGVHQDPSLPWSWTPIPGGLCHIDGNVDFRFNQLGFRGPLFQKVKSPDSMRIVCMGDSGTMGWGVHDGEMYCSQVQNLLEKRCHKKTETINAGVFGYTSYQGLHQLRERIIDIHPDIVTICYNWNDHAAAIHMSTFGGRQAWEHGVAAAHKELYQPDSYLGLYPILSNLRIYHLMQYGVLRMKDRSTSSQDEEKKNPDSELFRVSLKDFKDNLQEMIQLARKNHITPILLTEAFNPKRAHSTGMEIHYKRQQQYNNAVREIAVKMNVICVDPRPVLETDPKFFNSNTHCTKQGHHRIAGLLATAICQQSQSKI